MQNFYNIDKLNFLTAGMPLVTGKGGYPKAIEILREMNLDGMEVEFVHGVRMSDETRAFLKEIQKESPLVLTAHGPFYINLNSKEEDKVEASVQRIIDTAKAASDFGGYSITFHAAFYMGKDKEEVYQQVKAQIQKILEVLEQNNIKMWIRPLAGIEYTAKGEKQHLILEESDMNYKDLLKALKSFGVKGALVCESPNIETDTKILKDYYMSL